MKLLDETISFLCISVVLYFVTSCVFADECKDDRQDCLTSMCQLKPLIYLPGCKKTCQNCDGCLCYDSPIKLGGVRCDRDLSKNFCGLPHAFQKCPLLCGKCSLILGSNCPTVAPTIICRDELHSSICTESFCNLKPSVALVKCKKTCKNCDGCSCYDSSKPSGSGGNCKTLSKRYCSVKSSQEKCPVRCNLCPSIMGSQCPQCTDSYGKCTVSLCNEIPGTYFPKCRKTCNNCNGCTCIDSLRPPMKCSNFLTSGGCTDSKRADDALKYCAKTCGVCSQMQQICKPNT